MSMFTQGDDFYDMGYAKGRADSAKEHAEDMRELVEALRGLIAHYEGRDDYGTDFQYWKRARAALDKHRGQS